jgi:nucleoside-diphosphate-sugar epimerase
VSAISKAMEATVDGHEAYNVAAAENYLGQPAVEAFEEFFGEVPELRGLGGEDSALRIEKAAAELDWVPEHTWREAAEEPFDEPSFVAE